MLHYFQFEIERKKEYQKEEWSLEICEHEKEIERRKENQKDDWSFPNFVFVFRYINMKKKLGEKKKTKRKEINEHKSMNREGKKMEGKNWTAKIIAPLFSV